MHYINSSPFLFRATMQPWAVARDSPHSRNNRFKGPHGTLKLNALWLKKSSLKDQCSFCTSALLYVMAHSRGHALSSLFSQQRERERFLFSLSPDGKCRLKETLCLSLSLSFLFFDKFSSKAQAQGTQQRQRRGLRQSKAYHTCHAERGGYVKPH